MDINELKRLNKEQIEKINDLYFCIEKEKKRIEWLRNQVKELKTSRDLLTGVFNREVGLDILEKDISYAERHDHPVSVAFIDLENFTSRNKKLSHYVKDSIIVKMADLFKGGIRASDYMIRMDGAEFLLVFTKCNQGQAQLVVDRIIHEAKEQMDQDIQKGLSIGFACNKDDNINKAIELIHIADLRMNDSKQQNYAIAS